ncbi:MAG: CoB--CoM heterodisulfide reductase iron-sulfur subunit B family protein [Armatimonadetes bacterium]|nr:CoB--CoM heterodisulfide reductase iron-sulfur subunit B family protein [Armatimonadota bacterium]
MRYAYFPGCSLESTAKEFGESTMLVAEALGIELVEIPDWNCCGATSGHALDHKLSVALPARTLGIAESMGLDVVAPCAACYNRMKSAEAEIRSDSALRDEINAHLAKPYTGKVTVKSALEVFTSPDVLARVAEKVTKKLHGLKPACYYGCLLLRPPRILGFDDPEDPKSLDEAMRIIGAEPVEWYFKNECCGASFGISKSEIVIKLVGDIVSNAKSHGANCIVTVCPLCMTNLEMRQTAAGKQRGQDLTIPVFFFTELLGLAMEVPGIKKCFASHLIDVNPALDAITELPVETEPVGAAADGG